MRTDGRLMMCAYLSLILGVVPLVSLAEPSAWSDDPTPPQMIQASCDKAARLWMKKDLTGFSEIVAPDAVFLGNTKISNYAEWKRVLARQLALRQNLRTSIKVQRCMVKRNAAIAHIVKSDDFTLAAEKGHKFHVNEEITLLLNRAGKGWISTQVKFDSDTLTRDGKKVRAQQYVRYQETRGKGTKQ